MSTHLIDNFEKLNRTTVASVRRLGEINARTLERLGERQMAVTHECIDGSVKQMELLGQARGIQDVLSAQSRLVADLNGKIVEHFRLTTGILMEARSELADWMQSGVQAGIEAGAETADEVVKSAGTATKKVTKKAAKKSA